MVKMNFFLRKRGKMEKADRKGKVVYPVCPITMRVSFNGKRMELATGLHACECQWDKEAKRLVCDVPGTLPYTFVNKSLEQIDNAVDRLSATTQRKGHVLTERDMVECVSVLRERFAKTFALHAGQTSSRVNKLDIDGKSKRRECFMDAYQIFLKKEGAAKGWSKACREKYTATLNHLEKFEVLKGEGFKLSFDFFNEDGLTEYYRYLGNEAGLLNKTVKKNLQFLTRFLRWIFNHKYHTTDDFKIFSPVIRDPLPQVIALTEAELKQVRDCRLPTGKPSLQRTRDLFLFACYTGLRFSDVINIRYCDVHDDRLAITTMKTDDPIIVPLCESGCSILKKYMCKAQSADTIFPKISSQKINEHLKELGRVAGITSEVHTVQFRGEHRVERFTKKCDMMSFHVARRTFISLALSASVPPHVVMAITGKKTIASLRRYVSISDTYKMKWMNDIDSVFALKK